MLPFFTLATLASSVSSLAVPVPSSPFLPKVSPSVSNVLDLRGVALPFAAAVRELELQCGEAVTIHRSLSSSSDGKLTIDSLTTDSLPVTSLPVPSPPESTLSAIEVLDAGGTVVVDPRRSSELPEVLDAARLLLTSGNKGLVLVNCLGKKEALAALSLFKTSSSGGGTFTASGILSASEVTAEPQEGGGRTRSSGVAAPFDSALWLTIHALTEEE